MSQGGAAAESPKSEKNAPVEISCLDPRYECPICLSCLKDTVLTSCGHRFCSRCINDWMENRGDTCPVDGRKLNRTSDLFPDNYTRREIMNQRTACKICDAEINLYELDDHTAIHTNTPLEDSGKCIFRDIGCLMEVPREKMPEHHELQMHHHLVLMYKNHLELKKSVEKDGRRSSETLAQETKLWEPSPKDKGKEGSNDLLQSDSLIRSLYERIILSEQRNHEQEAHLQKLKNDLNKLESKFQDVSLRHCFGRYLWNINHFSSKLSAMKCNRDRFLYSPGFYTSPTGYKVCGRINISPHGEGQIALLIHLMKSPHDASLEWPFSGRLTLAIIHPTDNNLTVKETFVSRPDLEAFQRPMSDFNYKAFGYSNFISVNDIIEKGFLCDDTLTVKIDIQCI